MAQPRQIIIDTDAGFDDWLAMLFLMKRPDLQIIGVTVNGVGEATLQDGMTNVCNLLNYGLSGLQYYPNVYPGATTSLSANYGTLPATFRSMIDDFCGNTIPSGSGGSVISTTSATDYLRQAFDAAASAGYTVDVLAIGGFTNLAALFNAYPLAGPNGPPSYEAGIGTIYAMAGAISVVGDVCFPGDPEWSTYCPNNNAEWNVLIDPIAAQIVLGSGLDIVLVPLDATNYAPITKAFCGSYCQAAQNANDAYAEFICAILSNSPTPITDDSPNFFFDPLAVAVLATQAQSNSGLGLVWTSYQLPVCTDPGDTLGAIAAQTSGPLPMILTCAGTAQTSPAFNTLFEATTLPSSG